MKTKLGSDVEDRVYDKVSEWSILLYTLDTPYPPSPPQAGGNNASSPPRAGGARGGTVKYVRTMSSQKKQGDTVTGV